MRILDFIVDRQTLTRDPLCNFDGIAAESKGYLQARFRFSKEWAGCKKVAVFTYKGQDYPVGLVNNMCEIDPDALTGRLVQVRVIGRRPGFEITSTVAAFQQIVRR